MSATLGLVSHDATGLQVEVEVEASVLREDLQAARRIERFDIPLDQLKRMFEKPPAAAAAVETVSFFIFLPLTLQTTER